MSNDTSSIKSKFIAGSISGITEVICTHPIDLIKTKIQEASQKNIVINDPIKYFYGKYKFYGFQYLYNGFIPRIIGIVPMSFIYWGVQGNSNEYLKKYNIKDSSRLVLSGILAGSAQTLIDNPIETIKIRQMTSTKKSYIISKNVIFSGFGPTLSRNSLFAAIVNYTIYISPSENYSTYFFKGALGGLIASILTQPLDYIKTEKQRVTINKRSIKNIIISDYKFFMTGAIPRATLGLLNMGIGITIYTFMTKHILF